MAIINGTAGDDALLGTADPDILNGLDGHDFITGDLGDDALHGDAGDDYLRGDAGNDLLDGGGGVDRVAFRTASAGVTVDLNIQGVAQDTGDGFDTLVGIEQASGSIYDDTLIGDGGDNWLWGGYNPDTNAPGGNETISAGGGNDLVEVGSGNHNLDGGAGIDTLSYFSSEVGTSGSIVFDLALQGSVQATGQGSTSAAGFENLSGSVHGDNLSGDRVDNVLAGDLGDDTLSGAAGDDILYGDGRIAVDTHGTGLAGPITTFSDISATYSLTAGNDTLIGGRGNDTLYGGHGNDVLTGSQNSDRFVIEANSGNDRITDFANQDTIVFTASSGVDSFGDLSLTQVGRDTLVSWGTSDTLLLEGVRARGLNASDFDFGDAAAATLGAEPHGLHHQSAPGLDLIV